MAKLLFLVIFSCVALSYCKTSTDESCSASCNSSFGDRDKTVACKRGCRFYSLIHLITPTSSNKNVTAESCVLACRETSEVKEVQDTCTVGCTLQRIFVTKNEAQLSGQPLIDALLDTDESKLSSEEIIQQFVEFSAKMQLFAAQLFEELDEEMIFENALQSDTWVQISETAVGSPKSFGALNVRTYSVADDGRVTLIDELDREYTFVYSCFSLQIDAPFQRRMRQLIAEPIKTFKRLFSFVHAGAQPQPSQSQSRVLDVPGGVLEIKRTNLFQIMTDTNSQTAVSDQLDGVIDIGVAENISKRDFDWFFCVAARNSRLHSILLCLFALSCIGLLCACWVSLGHFSSGRKTNRKRQSNESHCCDDSDCTEDEDEEQMEKIANKQLDADSSLAPPPYIADLSGLALVVACDEKKAGVPVCVNDDDVLLCVNAEETKPDESRPKDVVLHV